MTVSDHNDRASSPLNSGAITPAELAKLIGRRLGEGFQPKTAHRSGLVTEGGGFVAADFRAMPSAGSLEASVPPQPEISATQQHREPSVVSKAPPPTVEPDATRNHAEELQAAYQRGLAEGREQGKADAERNFEALAQNDLQKARGLFVAATQAMQNPPAEATAALSKSISMAVARLASERAGLAISDHPAAFKARIEALSDRVSQGVRDVSIHLNAEDLELMKRYLGNDTDGAPNMVVSQQLARGDIEVRSLGISLTDSLDSLVSGTLA